MGSTLNFVVSFVVHSSTTQSLEKKMSTLSSLTKPSAGTQRKSVKSEVHGEPWGPINLHLAARLGRMQELREVACWGAMASIAKVFSHQQRVTELHMTHMTSFLSCKVNFVYWSISIYYVYMLYSAVGYTINVMLCNAITLNVGFGDVTGDVSVGDWQKIRDGKHAKSWNACIDLAPNTLTCRNHLSGGEWKTREVLKVIIQNGELSRKPMVWCTHLLGHSSAGEWREPRAMMSMQSNISGSKVGFNLHHWSLKDDDSME